MQVSRAYRGEVLGDTCDPTSGGSRGAVVRDGRKGPQLWRAWSDGEMGLLPRAEWATGQVPSLIGDTQTLSGDPQSQGRSFTPGSLV